MAKTSGTVRTGKNPVLRRTGNQNCSGTRGMRLVVVQRVHSEPQGKGQLAAGRFTTGAELLVYAVCQPRPVRDGGQAVSGNNQG